MSLGFTVSAFEEPNILVIRIMFLLYRKICNWKVSLRRVRMKQQNTDLVVSMVRQQFRKNMHETDPEKIQKLKDDAARGLINHILHEAERLSGRKFSQTS